MALRHMVLSLVAVTWIMTAIPSGVAGQEASAKAKSGADSPLAPKDDWKRISEDSEVWIDEKNQQVVVGGEVCLDKGVLEMFACLKRTKEHESVVAARTKAYIVHAALLAVGAEIGRPVSFVPEYRPASGTPIDITVQWIDADGKSRTAKAQEWIRNLKTKEPLAQTWVFTGSGFWEDPDTGRKHYMAESGDFICVSNFSSAMLDLPIESSQGNEELLFEAFTENIPPRGTNVLLFLKPRLEKEKDALKEK